MAKAKKKTALSVEERLERALVPEAEQPYPVPENWCWVKLPYTFINLTDSKKKVKQKEYLDEGDTPIIDQGQELVGGYTNQLDLVFRGNLPVIIFGDHTRCLKFVNFPFVQGADGVKVLQPKSFFLPLCFFYAMHSLKIPHLGYRRHFPLFNTFALPLPPLSEQQRIINRIESLFAKLDEAKEKAQAALDSFETRKAAILHKAFTGDLIHTKKIETVPLEYIVNDIRIGPFGTALHKHDYITNGVPVINPKHINNQTIVPQYNVTISEEKATELSAYRLRENDVILGRRGEMGRCAPVTKTEDGWLCGTGSMILRLKKSYCASFYSSIISSQSSIQYLEEHAVGSTLKNLNEKIVSKIPVPDFPKTEQVTILAKLSNLLLKEQKAKELCSVLDKIDLIKKSILARAFRGELGTNDPTEESALDLLKSIV